MIKAGWRLAAGALLCSLQGEALAFRLNPCLRVLTITDTSLSEWSVRARNVCGVARGFPTVHEHMTLASVGEYRQRNGWQPSWTTGPGNQAWRYMEDTPWQVVPGVRHQTYGLVYGTWWNDDPLMYMTSGNFAAGLRNFSDSLDKTRASYVGSTDGCPVAASQSLPLWSHYGALQHIHFMTTLPASSTADQRIDATLAGAWNWLQFAYEVAIGKIQGSSKLTPGDEQRLSLPSIARNTCLRHASSARVRTIFTQVGPSTAENLAARDRLAADVALGTMLHVLQDSFSPAHTCRVLGKQDGKPVALLVDVYNFNEQDKRDHEVHDMQPAWLLDLVKRDVRRYSNDPVTTGAWLLRAVDNRLPWEQVREHLGNTIFARNPSNPSFSKSQCLELS